MLADLRFVLGAILAVALLAVTGLGVVTSVALMREAHMRPIEGSRSLAYAGPAERNEFYDPDGAWRVARDDAPATPLEPPATAAPDAAPEQTASIPGSPPAAEAAPVIADLREPPQATEILATPPASTPVPAEEAVPPDATLASEPASVERLASAPTSPAADPQPPAASPAVSSTDLPPTPRPRPTLPRRKRTVRAIPPAPASSPPNPPFFWPLWPAFGEQPGAPTAANKSGPLAGPSANRSQ